MTPSPGRPSKRCIVARCKIGRIRRLGMGPGLGQNSSAPQYAIRLIQKSCTGHSHKARRHSIHRSTRYRRPQKSTDSNRRSSARKNSLHSRTAQIHHSKRCSQHKSNCRPDLAKESEMVQATASSMRASMALAPAHLASIGSNTGSRPHTPTPDRNTSARSNSRRRTGPILGSKDQVPGLELEQVSGLASTAPTW